MAKNGIFNITTIVHAYLCDLTVAGEKHPQLEYSDLALCNSKKSCVYGDPLG
jgi:DNA polymerase III epsilon subunit-like protein